MDKEKNANDLKDETPYRARARASHDEDSTSYIKPIIKELVRTQVCVPNIKLLVDKISIVKVLSTTESSGLEAYRMYLTDREKTIQGWWICQFCPIEDDAEIPKTSAVVRRRLHKWLTTFDVREGSFVVLKEYNLARGKRLLGEGDVFYLAISDFYSIGEEPRYNHSIDLENNFAIAEEDTLGLLDRVSAEDEDKGDEVETFRTEHSPVGSSPAEAHQDSALSKFSFSSTPAVAEPKKRKRGSVSLDLDPDLLPTATKGEKLTDTSSAKMEKDDDRQRSSGNHFPSASTPNIPLSRQDSTQVQASHEDVPSPLHLSTLASVTGTNTTRNKQVNIFAMIEHVSNSTVKPTTLPLKRDVRIVDPSTDKKVTLSVFVDPVDFKPNRYDIMLFCNLTTHNFSGGSLNAYPKRCRGKEWYILNPYDVEECDMKSMEVFREYYRNLQAQTPEGQTTGRWGLSPF